MSNVLTGTREALRTLLGGPDANVFLAVPEIVSPPATFIAPGEPYLTYEGAAFGSAIVHCSVVLVAGRGTNEANAEDLDDRLLAALGLLEDDDTFHVVNVAQPGQITLSGQAYLAASIEVQTEVRL